MKLNEVFTDITNGIFSVLNTEYGTIFEWLQYHDALDLEYLGNRSGQKETSPLVDLLMKPEVPQNDISLDKKKKLAKIIYTYYSNKWAKDYAVMSLDYNPIQNYDMTQTETPNITRTHSSQDYTVENEHTVERDIKTVETPTNRQIQNTKTIEKDVSVTETPTNRQIQNTKTIEKDVTETDTYNDHIHDTETKTKTDQTVSSSSNGNNDVFGFNSGSAVHQTANSGTVSTRTLGDADDNVVTGQDKETGSISHQTTAEAESNIETDTQVISGTVETRETADADSNIETDTQTISGTVETRQTADADSNIETDTRTESGTYSDSETGTRQLTRSGNIGVTTSQQMIQSEIELWMWNFFDMVFTDVDRVLTCPKYNY